MMRVAVIFVLCSLTLFAQELEGGLEHQLRRAEGAMDQFNYRFAIATLTRISKHYPKDGRADIMRGECLFSLDRHREALSAYEKGLARQPEYKVSVPNYPYVQVKLGKLEEAEKNYRFLLKKAKTDTDRSQGHYGIGLVALYRAKLDEAAIEFEKAKALNSRSVKINYRLALLYKQRREVKKSIAQFERVLSLRGLHEAAAYNLATLYAQAKDKVNLKKWRTKHREIREAQRLIGGLRASLTKSPGDVVILEKLARIYTRHRSWGDAVGPWRIVTLRRSDMPEARLEYGRALFHLGQHFLARRQFEQVLQVNSSDTEAKRLLDRIMKEFGGGKDMPGKAGLRREER